MGRRLSSPNFTLLERERDEAWDAKEAAEKRSDRALARLVNAEVKNARPHNDWLDHVLGKGGGA